MVAGLERGDVGSDLFDDAGRLMPQDARVGRRHVALIVVEIAVADAGRLNFDQHLVAFWPVDFHFLDRQLARTL